MTVEWFWPGGGEINDIPDPLGIEDQWRSWIATMEEGPPVQAEIFSREYIQNSWDSIQRKTEGGGTGAIRFKFVELKGQQAQAFAQQFGLEGHATRITGMAPTEREGNRLGEAGEQLEHGGFETVRLLIASEELGEGMPGWKANDRTDVPLPVMRIALIQSVTGKDDQGATGGSWGQGKKAVAAGSSLRTLAAYTCHPPSKEEPDVTRRFVGVTYWRPYSFEKHRHRGLGLFGKPLAEGEGFREFEPLEDDTADAFVESLGIPELTVRTPENEEDHGTTYLFVEPSFGPEDLAKAISRNWWPLLVDQKLELEVTAYDGTFVELPTRGDKTLYPFIQAFDIANGRDEPNNECETRETVVINGEDAGKLALVSDVSDAGWSYDQPENGNSDLVALIRNDMVIAYQQFPMKRGKRGTPYVRGTFIVAPQGSAGETLKMTEGHLHNEWKTDPKQVGDADRARFAGKVLEQINKQTKALRARISKSEEARDVPIRAFEEVFASKGPSKGAHTKTGSGSGESWPRDFVIHDASKATPRFDSDDPTSLRLEADVGIALRPDHKDDAMKVRVRLGWKVQEESMVSDPALVDETKDVLPKGFKRVGDDCVGTLTKTEARFSWASNAFPNDWRVSPDPEVSPDDGGN